MNSNTKKSWIFLGLTVVSFALGVLISEWIYSSLGYEVGTTNAPIRVKLIMVLVSFVIIFSMPALSILFGRRAMSQGDVQAKTPYTLSLIIIIGYGFMNLISLFITR